MNRKKMGAIIICCFLLVYCTTAFAKSGIYQYTNSFQEAVAQNPLDRDYEAEFKSARTTYDYGSLEGKYIKLWDRELNVAYNKLLNKLAPQQKEMLIDSQVAWLSWHLQETKFVDKTFLSDRSLGSQGPIQELKAQKYRLRERTLELMEYYCLLGGATEFQYQ